MYGYTLVPGVGIYTLVPELGIHLFVSGVGIHTIVPYIGRYPQLKSVYTTDISERDPLPKPPVLQRHTLLPVHHRVNAPL